VDGGRAVTRRKSKTAPVDVTYEQARQILEAAETAGPQPLPPPLDGTPAAASFHTKTVDLAPIHDACKAAGWDAPSIVFADGVITIRNGAASVTGATVAEVAAAIRTYNCPICATGGGHAGWCERAVRP
jgi:hypothetical protein